MMYILALFEFKNELISITSHIQSIGGVIHIQKEHNIKSPMLLHVWAVAIPTSVWSSVE